MCIILGENPIHAVRGTQIYARRQDNYQYLVYSMSIESNVESCMILPLPIAPGSGEDACEFIALDEFADFFEMLNAMFAGGHAVSLGGSLDAQNEQPPLTVHQVGRFIASFVPSKRDFTRLAPQFRGTPQLWASMPGYDDWGFAVFRLDATVPSRDGDVDMTWMTETEPQTPWRSQTIHPMALRFPTRDERLFFPTVHVHDGQFHHEASFDHSLFTQASAADRKRIEAINRDVLDASIDAQRRDHLAKGKDWNDKIEGFYRRDGWVPWWSSEGQFGPEPISRSQQILSADARLYMRRIHGNHPNTDVWV